MLLTFLEAPLGEMEEHVPEIENPFLPWKFRFKAAQRSFTSLSFIHEAYLTPRRLVKARWHQETGVRNLLYRRDDFGEKALQCLGAPRLHEELFVILVVEEGIEGRAEWSVKISVIAIWCFQC